MKNIYLLFTLLLCYPIFIQAQMPGTGKFGNEWIRYDQPYFKISVAQDGIYKIPYETLAAAGFPVSSVSAAQLQLFHLGEQVPIFTSSEGVFTATDFIEFYGKKNRGELDRFLYKNGEADMLNPEYSMFTDTAAYFLTIATEANQPLRYPNSITELNNLPEKEEWFWGELSPTLSGSFVESKVNDVSESSFEFGEGFGVTRLKNQEYSVTLKPVHRSTTAAADNFSFRLVGIGTNPHFIQIRINGNLLDSTIISPSNQVWNRQFLYTQSGSASDVNIRLIDTIGRFGISNLTLLYPRTFNFENKNQFTFKITSSGTEKYLEITNFQHNNTDPILYDLTSEKRIVTELEGGIVKVKLDAFTGTHEFYLVNTTSGVITGELVKVELNNFPETDAEFIIITSRKLRGAAVDAYADYRSKDYKVALVDVEDLYEQFAYGIQRHPLAIRNFGHYIKNNWGNAKFVLIIGKAREFNNNIRSYSAAIDAQFFVPTFGYPGSDNLLLASNTSQMPALPIGRIAATGTGDIQMYLEKLKQYENPNATATEDRSWRKEVIHLGGGKVEWEQNSIASAMDRIKQTITENKYGANVSTYYKKSTDQTQRLESEEINRLLQQGVGVITFFGHGGYNVIEISIGEPSSYTNYKKYPVMFALGCYSGNIHTPNPSYSENFVFQSQKAGIAFVGTASLGTISDLGFFQQTVYEHLGEKSYGKSLGEIVQASIQQHDANFSSSSRALLQQFTLHGDPALKINAIDAPDYLVDQKSVQFNPSSVSIRDEVFNLKFNILNIGKNIKNDSLSLKITRRLPNGVQKIVPAKIKAPAYRSELLSYPFPIKDSSGSTAGFNEFLVALDPSDDIKELPAPEAENNNELRDAAGVPGIKLFIFDKGVTPVEPLNYAIVNTAPLKLRASTANVFETEQRYRIAIDTTKYFNSLLQDDTLISTTTGGVLEWQPKITLLDSTVYYWRVTLDSLIQDEYNWTTSSFTYIQGSPPGWRQGHFQQLQENIFQEMSLPDSTQKLAFAPNPSNVVFSNFQYPLSGYSYLTILEYSSINRTPTQYLGGILSGGVIISVLDGNSGNPWYNVEPGKFGSVVGESWAWRDVVNNFPYSTTTPQARKQVIDFLKDSIPDGNYVLLYTIQHTGAGIDYKPEQWAADSLTIGTNLFKVLNAEGAKMIDSTATKGARPYVIFYRKGRGKPIFEELANSVQDTVFGSYTIPGFKTEGGITSRQIGPAKQWARLQKSLKTDEYDNYDITLYGIREDETLPKTPLLTNFTAADTSLEWINADLYPYLELQLNARDTVRRSPPQYGYWQVLYEGIPEAALNPLAHFNMPKDTIQEGESLIVDIAISNLSAYDMDSLLVHYRTISETNQVRPYSVRLKPLPKQDSILFSLRLPSQDLAGKYELQIEVNPTEDQPDQPELYHFNNIGVLNFYVRGEKRNPLVDVTFDGMRILNGDLVSAKPQIVVSLQDENPYLSLTDTSTIELWIQAPDQSPDKRQRIPFDQVRFESGKPNEKGSKATIYYEPEFVVDGLYTLYVNGKDASANRAGSIEYQVEFEVITKAMISNVFNYPNPFTTSTQFVYTLTGAEPPPQYKIQVMSVSGRIVRELTELDLGPLRIGMHRTELAWDGTDQYGDRLANGVYLYRVIAKNQEGKDYEKYENGNGTDRFFKKNIGKLVILR